MLGAAFETLQVLAIHSIDQRKSDLANDDREKSKQKGANQVVPQRAAGELIKADEKGIQAL